MIKTIKNIIRNYMIKYNNFVIRVPYTLFVATIIITAVSLWLAFKLDIKTDFFELLPANYRSITDLNKVVDRVGGVGNLLIAIETDNFEAGKKYVEDVAADLKKLPKDKVMDVTYNIQDVKKYYSDNVLFYLDKEDLKTIKQRLEAKLEYEKKNNNPLYFFKEMLTPVEFKIDDIKKKYTSGKDYNQDSFQDGYLVGENNTLFVIMIRPQGTAASISSAKVLVGEVEKILSNHPASNYNAKIIPHLCGNFKSMVEEYDVIINDVVSTLLLVFLLVGVVIFIFLGTLSSIVLLLFSLSVSSAWTMGITYLKIGYLNSQTAFLTSLVVGTGVNYGIIYLARYYEERKKGRSISEAISISSQSTIIQTFLASATTAVAFVTLMFAHTRGFSHFGFIGSVGVTLCWINTFIILPILIVTWEKFASRFNISDKVHININIFKPISKWIMKKDYIIHAVYTVLVIFSVYYFVQYYNNKLETDFSKLRNIESANKGTAYWDEKVGNLFGNERSLTPGIVVVDNQEEAAQVCKSIDKKMAALPAKFKNIASCQSVDRLLPEKQNEKLPVIKEIKELLYSGSIKFLNDSDYDKIIKFRDKIKTRQLVTKDLPPSLTKNFNDLQGNKGVVVVVNPKMEQKITENLTTFSDLIRENTLDNGKKVYSSGESVIYADLLNAIAVDGPMVSIYALVAVMLMVIISVRNTKDTVIIMFVLLLGTVLMFGFVSFFNIKLNFFNFIAIPLSFGICVDYGANLYLRYKQDGDMKLALDNIGQAVFLCSMTTVVSYITLIVAKNQALVSFGKIALIGEVASIFITFLVLPAIIATLDRRKNKKQNKYLSNNSDDTNKKVKDASEKDCFCDYQ